MLYQHFHNQVTQPLLHEELLELGVDISSGQVNTLLTQGHELFHQEKDIRGREPQDAIIDACSDGRHSIMDQPGEFAESYLTGKDCDQGDIGTAL